MDIESYFDLSVTATVFPAEEIERRRAVLGDTLLYDILLTLGGIREPDTFYPPHDSAALSRLLSGIESSTYDALKKDCLVYFLLKWYQDGRENKFQADRCIPPQFALLADAYWCLDAGVNVSRAVSILSDSRLNRDYASKILQAIATTETPESHALVVKYIRTAKPLLTEPDDMVLYALSLAESTSLFAAWQFQRSFAESDPTRTMLLNKLFEWCVSPTPRITPLTHLLSLPLTPFEQNTLHTYASSSPSPSSALARATLQSLSCTRLIQTGAYASAITLHRKFENTSSALLSHPQAKKSLQDRTAMIQSLYAALPVFERALLDDEMNGAAVVNTGGSALPPTNANVNAREMGEDVQMSDSQSWEDLGKSSQLRQVNGDGAGPALTTAPSSQNQPRPVPARVPASFSLDTSTVGGGVVASRSGATRFGGAPPVLSSSMSTSTSTAATTGVFGPQTGTGLGAGAGVGVGGFVVGGLNGLNGSMIGTGGQPPLLSQSHSPKEPRSSRPSLPLSFSTSGRKQNAFYKPTVVPSSSTSVSGKTALGGRYEEQEQEERGMDEEESEGEGGEQSKGMDVDLDEYPGRGGGELGYSLFSTNADRSQTRSSANRESMGFGSVFRKSLSGANSSNVNVNANERGMDSGLSMSTSASKKRPPGAFDDDYDDDDNEEEPSASASSLARNGHSKTTTKASLPPAKSTTRTQASTEASTGYKSKTKSSSSAKSKPKTRQNQNQRESTSTSALKRSVPGGMYPSLSLSGSDHDESDFDEGGHAYDNYTDNDEQGTEVEVEAEDVLPPLRATSKRGTGRKTRSSAAASLALSADEDSGGARRRSSRLSGAPASAGGRAGAKDKEKAGSKGRTKKSAVGAGAGVEGEVGVKTRSGAGKRRVR